MYVLAIIGSLMLVQGVSEIDRARKKIVIKKNPRPLLDTWPSF